MDDPAPVDQEVPLQLKRVPTRPSGQEPLGRRPYTTRQHARIEQRSSRCLSESVCPVGMSPGIDQHGILQRHVLDERDGFLRRAGPDHHDLDAGVPKRLPLAVQVQRVLLAKRASEMAEKHQRQSDFGGRPQVSERDPVVRDGQDGGIGCGVSRPHDRCLLDRWWTRRELSHLAYVPSVDRQVDATGMRFSTRNPDAVRQVPSLVSTGGATSGSVASLVTG